MPFFLLKNQAEVQPAVVCFGVKCMPSEGVDFYFLV